MKIEVLSSPPEPALAAALEQFEARFRYPLGPGRSFRISHGNDYTRFFQAIGEVRCFVARDAQRVLGIVSVSLCEMHQPDGESFTAAYFSDLKVDSPAMGPVLMKLLSSSIDWARRHATRAFSVVMDGTPNSPEHYTGRLGLPRYVELARLMILRVPAASEWSDCHGVSICSLEEARSEYRKLSRGAFRTAGGDSRLRSLIEPMGLKLASGEGCAVLEDTRRCKLLYSQDEFSNTEEEMISAHLDCFAYSSPGAAAALIRAATTHCRERQIPALFAAIPRNDCQRVLDALSIPGVVQAPATVYGFGFPQKANWFINTAEI